MVKVSVLMAVYNAECYLHKSLDSLLSQTVAEIQVICVDDASSDDSWSLLQQYAEKDSRIEIIRMAENRGQAVARNIALKHAVGEYVTFLDADDWYAPDTLEQALNVFEAHEATDCVLFDVRYVDEAKNMEHGYCWKYPVNIPSNADGSFVCMSGREAFLQSLTWNIHGWYIIKGDIFRRIPYDDTCRHYSDDNTTRPHFRACREVRCCKGKYYYRQIETSVTHVVSTSRMDYMKANASMKQMLIDWHESDEVVSLYEYERWKVVVGSYLFYYLNRNKMDSSAIAYCLAEIRKYWMSIENCRLSWRYKCKLGYYPFLNRWLPRTVGWILFCAEEELYFTLKKMMKKR